MKIAKLLVVAALLGAAQNSAGAETLRGEIDWKRAEVPPGAEVVDTDRGWRAVRFVWDGEGPKTFPLARFESPGITANHYAVGGELRYEGVEPGSYLEMWNHLPGGAAFFSRTLAPAGPMASLGGSSGWRSFSLPAFLDDHPERPTLLELNLVLAGPGSVEIGPLTLNEGSSAVNGGGGGGGGDWWGPRAGGLVGSFGGSTLGLVGALLGVLVGLGRARRLVLVVAALTLAAGVAALALAGVALAADQPYGVVYPLALIGALTVLLMAVLLFTAPQRYRRLELRRMRALDAS